MSSEFEGFTPKEYIEHHLVNWTVGRGFWALNLDSLLISCLLGAIFIFVFHQVARRSTLGVPGKLQCAVEYILETVQQIVLDAFPKKNPFIGSVALTLFVWLILINAMDFIPIDVLPWLLSFAGCHYFRPVPSADINVTMGLALGVLCVMIGHGISVHGGWGWIRKMSSHPFGHWSLAPVNLALELTALLSKTFGLGIRLFANMCAGELLFAVIAVLCPWWMQWIPFGVWAAMHLLIVVLQALIFTTLSVTYIGMQGDEH